VAADIIDLQQAKQRLSGNLPAGHEPGETRWLHDSHRVQITCSCGWASYWAEESQLMRIYFEHLRLAQRRHSGS